MTLRQHTSLAVSPEQIREAWRDLGRQLAEWRKAAALTQHQLTALTWHSRSSIANIETGRQTATRQFWEQVDRELGGDGVLVKAFAQADDLTRDYAEQTRAAHQAQANEDRPVNVIAVIVVVIAVAPSQPCGRANRFPPQSATTNSGGNLLGATVMPPARRSMPKKHGATGTDSLTDRSVLFEPVPPIPPALGERWQAGRSRSCRSRVASGLAARRPAAW